MDDQFLFKNGFKSEELKEVSPPESVRELENSP